ncbi:MAG: hypothetical protein IIU02_07990 [Treponema sp.]|uniref:hypothetical protein n=1 Tax=Treponema sp. TaxID=166 RepID=UPI0025798BA2|nr:hypothetical protein [Treponema sp.]MBQ5537833.1 hypothetical protein [Treponema sp.]
MGKISAEGVGRNGGRFYAVYGGVIFCFFDYVFLQQCGGIFESFGTAGWGIVFCSFFLKKNVRRQDAARYADLSANGC